MHSLGSTFDRAPSTGLASDMSGFSLSSEPFTLSRDCDAVMVPQGNVVSLPAGQIGYITQALGGSFTVYVEGNLFRIAGKDADALGKEPPPPIVVPDNATDADVEKLAWDQLRTVFDPEIPVNVVELGLVYDLSLEQAASGERKVYVKLTLTAPGCGMGDILVDDARTKLEMIPTIGEADVDLVFDPPWNQSMMSDAAKLETGML
jgi:probable FeS assembly SUF system protein SufT